MNKNIMDEQGVATTKLSKDEQLRYSRHMIMPEVGAEGQSRLNAARVLCIGAGGLGSPAALYLAAAGVGKLGLVDFDDVDPFGVAPEKACGKFRFRQGLWIED